MKNKNILLIIISLSILIFSFSHTTYARYILKRDFNIIVSSQPFYFNATNPNNIITFNRTEDTKDYDVILMDNTNFNITIQNNNGTNYNDFDVTYEISIIDSPKFSFSDNSNTITRTIKGGNKIDEVLDLNLKIKDMENPSKNVKIRVTAIKPYKSEPIDLTYSVIQLGAIQTIEDLLDLSLNIRGLDKNGQAKAIIDISNQRFKMTRDLDFEDRNSYDNADRTDYGDVNLNGKEAQNLYDELTSETGFLPIGELEHPFKGAFNGGNHTLSHLEIHKSLQINIGFFGTTNGATIKNITIEGDVLNHNQTAGMIIGKMYGGELNNVTVRGIVVSTDELNHNQDTYSGGLVGYVNAGATIKNCTNYAQVITQFEGDATNYSGPAGGIAAWMSHSTIEGCINYGEVIGQSYVGGIVGFSGMQVEGGSSSDPGGGTVTHCENHGYVHYYAKSGTLPSNWGKHIGGIAGYNKKDGIIENNINHSDANILGKQNVGGIVGNNSAGGIVRNNTNKSTNVNGNSSVGRIVGGGTKPSASDGNKEDYT